MLVRLVVPVTWLVGLAGFAFGAAPVATVTSSETFDLDGAAVRTEGIPFWPLMAGDKIATHASSALVRFQDGTSVTLGPNARATVETVANGLEFRMSSGTMQVNAAPTSAVKFFDRSQPVTVRSGGNSRVSSPMREELAVKPPPPPPPPNPVSGR